ncbi:response regulator [Kaistella antarctica]|uniref:Staphylococcus exoprotein expression protein R n=1 Tax=Kaistella antarctica TaxID=266748 RepID=A0A3S5EUS1_9FLAO|nr:response regulator [Kaistella antarctica]KEY18964.1 transcriptional regulator [Kaistella antarctica]SEW13297.1 cAMP-binding domain of CRP or a regulatory subunit of cAMP-dependent protein kinases [Kaistella antarctica]VEH99175.1 Staphylococcus exoprotein expression protein R [Kaistella antarctica]
MKKILVIEDNQDVRDNTADILELEGFEVTTAENGKIGVELATELLPDVIICDIMMPVLDGYEVLEELNNHPETSSIPFIFLTAKTERTDLRKGMNLGADDYLTKPFTDQELLEAIESRLKKYDFLKEEFSQSIYGVSQFMDAAVKYLDLDHISSDYPSTTFEKKEEIFREGETANHLYYIESGVIKTFKTTEKGKEFVTGLCSAGDFVGQLSLLSETGTYTESASVLEDAVVFEIPKIHFTKLVQENRIVANKFMSLISNNLVEAQDQIVNVAYATVRQRVAKALLEIHHQEILVSEEDPGIGISREDFASLIGTATETAIRMLTQFNEEGIISYGPERKIIIEDKKALDHIVMFG